MEKLTRQEKTILKSLLRCEILENSYKIQKEEESKNVFSQSNIEHYQKDNEALERILNKLN